MVGIANNNHINGAGENACLNYHEFDFEGDLVGVPHTWCLSAQSFITLLKLV